MGDIVDVFNRVKSTQRITSSLGFHQSYRDGGILDFGREHVFLEEPTGCAMVLPHSLVTFISEQAVKEYLKGSEHGIGAAGGNSNEGHGQARQQEAGQGDADSAGVARPGSGRD